LVCHGEFLIKALLVRGLERIFSFFPSLSAIPRELIQHSDFLRGGSVTLAFLIEHEALRYKGRYSTTALAWASAL